MTDVYVLHAWYREAFGDDNETRWMVTVFPDREFAEARKRELEEEWSRVLEEHSDGVITAVRDPDTNVVTMFICGDDDEEVKITTTLPSLDPYLDMIDGYIEAPSYTIEEVVFVKPNLD